MNKFFLFLSLSLAMSYPVIGHAKELELAPSSPWHVIYDDDSCRLARMFGADKQTVLTFQLAAPQSLPRVSVYGPPIKPLVMGTNDVMYAFGAGQKLVRARHAFPGTAGEDKQPLIILGELDLLNRDFSGDAEYRPDMAPTRESLAAIDRLTIARPGTRVVLDTGSMAKAFDVLAVCSRDLVKSWGLDPDQQAALASRPEPLSNPSTWLRSTDYPAAALRAGKSASIQFRLMVDSTGLPSACKVQTATQSPEFIDLTCKLLMKRARFSPARDAAGNAAASYHTNSVNWVILRP